MLSTSLEKWYGSETTLFQMQNHEMLISCIDGSRAQAVRALLRDRARLKEERQTFKAKQRSYAGYSRDQMLMSPHSAGGFDSMGRAASLRRSVRPHPHLSFCIGGHRAADLLPVRRTH